MLEGTVLGVLTFIGFWAIFRKLPGGIRKVVSHPSVAWISDILLTIGAYIALSSITSSFAGATGCAVAGILVSIYLGRYGDNAWKMKSQKQPT